MLCFVEVKTRTNLEMALPREYVTAQKQNRLRKTALLHGVPFAYGEYLPRGIPQGLVHAARRADIDVQRTAQSVFGKRFPHRAAAAHTGHGAGMWLALGPFTFQISLRVEFNAKLVHFLFLS